MSIKQLFVAHPASVGESYREHMQTALSFAAPLAKAAGAAWVHAFLPFVFTSTASRTVKTLNDRMSRRCSSCAQGPVHRPDLYSGHDAVGAAVPVQPRASPAYAALEATDESRMASGL